jgi:putative two-component system response regulator
MPQDGPTKADRAQYRGTVLVVDDSNLNRVALSKYLTEADYLVETAKNGEEALGLLRSRPFDVTLLDLNMPGIDGFAVLEQMKSDSSLRHIPVIVISGSDEMDTVARCIQMGAADHLPKPFNPVLLRARIHASFAAKRQHDQEEVYRREIERSNRTLESRVQEQVQQLRESFAKMRKTLEGTVLALSSAVEIRDPYTAGHQQRVTSLACAIGREMGMTEDKVDGLRVAGLLHDIGKICVPAEILVRPGRISDIEFSLIKVHVQVGHDILSPIEFPWPIARIVVQHHENWDGSGYPAGCAGNDILVEARILKVADCVEAMATNRPYRAALGIDAALDEISRNSGIRYDPVPAEICKGLFEKGRFQFPERLI